MGARYIEAIHRPGNLNITQNTRRCSTPLLIKEISIHAKTLVSTISHSIKKLDNIKWG